METFIIPAFDYADEQFLINNIISKYDYYNDIRSSQISDNRLIKHSIYNSDIPAVNSWDCKIQLPEIYELAQTLKSHIVQNLYSHPDGMFDVSGVDYKTQKYANKQKAMLVNTFETMKIEDEMEKIIDSVVETGEVTLFVGWETKTRKVRRALSLVEQAEKNIQDAFEKYIEYRYKSAEKALKAGDKDTAYRNYKAIAKEDYKDSQAKFVTLEKEHIKNTAIGKKISFAYMDWRVLDKQDGKVLLLKDNSLGSTPFDETGKNVTWESSSVRKWLNGDFLNDNFFKAEQNAILDTTVKNTANPVYNTPAGKDTTDKLFLLSYDEVAQYKKGIHKTKSCWWLRTPGAAANSMSFVYKDKTVMEYGYEVTNTKITVKPATIQPVNINYNNGV